jgi:hypothetical protein
MRRTLAVAAAALALLFLGYEASGIGNAGTVVESTSSDTSSSSSIASTTTETSTTTTAMTTKAPLKVTICHRTSAKKHPYLRIRVAVAELKKHLRHKGDIIPAPGGVCPHHVVKVRNHHIVYKHLP